uniref:Uncharacterized protein n=1 Tax=Oryza nivara TaxID=4536 RepID=A0A0E0G618_ORYNI
MAHVPTENKYKKINQTIDKENHETNPLPASPTQEIRSKPNQNREPREAAAAAVGVAEEIGAVERRGTVVNPGDGELAARNRVRLR